MSNDGRLIELDDRRRCSLGKVGRPDHTRYLVEEQRDGTLIFTPAVVLTEEQARAVAERLVRGE